MRQLLKTYLSPLGLQIRLILSTRSRTELIELAFIGAIFFFLPFKEAPKNVFLFTYFAVWVANRYRDGRWGAKDYWFEGPLVLISLLGILGSGYAAENKIDSLIDGIDFLTMAFLAIVLRRSVFKPEQTLSVIVVATSIGIIFSITEGLILGYPFPSLKSVGHINHIAIFLTIYFTLVLSLFAAVRGVIQSLGLLSLLSAILVMLLATGSRNAAVSSLLLFVILISIILFLGYRRKLFVATILVGMVITVAAPFTFVPELADKQAHHLSRGGLDIARTKVWKTALIACQENTILGYGVGNFASATSEQNLRTILESISLKYNGEYYLHTNHAHNLFYNWLVERGLLALLLLCGWILFLCKSALIASIRHRQHIDVFSATSTDSGLSASFILILFAVPLGIVSMGFWNTTFHHEHGILAIAAIAVAYRAVCLSRDRLSYS
jgi:O-antigen ligase